MKKIISLLICIAFTFTLFSCSELPTETTAEDISSEKASSENTDNVLGKGETVIYVDVITPDKTERFTVYTDSKVLGTAIQECGLAEGAQGDFGVYIKTVNGIVADADVNGAYWSVQINGEPTPTGADGVTIENGGVYELEYTPYNQ